MAEELEPQFAEDEDLERARAFWKENGRSIIVGVGLGLAAIAGYNGWQSWQKNQGESASILFENLQDSSISDKSAAKLTGDLMQDYGNSPYAVHAALLMAGRSVEAGDSTRSRSHLQWVLDNSKDDGMKHIARIRLAMVLLSEQDADGVLGLVQGVDGGEFSARYDEISGDAYAQKGDLDAARRAYAKSQQALPPGASNSALLKLKLDNLGQLY
jgi:predicted negative regulator of RcsB-dependent stress response